MKRKTIWNVVYVILFLLMLAGEALALATIVHLDMLPKPYLAAVIGLFLLLALAVGLLLFLKGKRPGNGRRVIASVLAVLVLLVCAAVSTVATDVFKTIEASNRQDPNMPTREIYVGIDNTAMSLADTAGFTYGYVKGYEDDCTRQVLDVVVAETGGNVATAGFTNTFTMAKALLEDRIDAMILSGAFAGVIEETGGFLNFTLRTRILAQVPVIETEPPVEEATEPPTEETEPPTEETTPAVGEVDYAALKPFAVYMSGSDSYDTEIIKNSRNDVNILAVVNPLSKQVLLVNTPRDYYIRNPAAPTGKDKLTEDKLTHCGIYGVNCSMTALSNLYGLDIEYFVRINFSGFKKFIDALGGITVYSDYPFIAITRTYIAQGENHLTGQEALDFARERYTLPDGDNERGRHQMQVITAVIDKATDGPTIISNYNEIIDSVEGMFQMNIPMDMVSNLVKMQLSDLAQWNVVSYGVYGYGSMEECYSIPGMELAVVKPSQSSISKASRLIDLVYEGEILTEEVVNSIAG